MDILSRIQKLLVDIYKVSDVPDVTQHVFSDRDQLTALTRHTEARVSQTESLLLCQQDEELFMSLFLDPGMLERLAQRNPFVAFDTHNANDFWVVLEGVSHFVYAAVKATQNRPFSMLELELQAEVDKFIASLLLLYAQGNAQSAKTMHNSLFSETELAEDLSSSDQDRYKFANDYAARYCWSLLTNREINEGSEFSRELQQFYQLPQHSKIRRIDGAMYTTRCDATVS